MASRMAVYAVLAAAVFGCADADDNANLDVVRIGMHGRLTSAAMFLADEGGFFAREGIRLQHIETPRGSQALPLLDRGDLDVLGTVSSVALFSALDMGARFRIVADRAHLDPDGCVVDAVVGGKHAFANDSPTADEVRGKRFAARTATTSGYMLAAYLRTLDLTLRDIEVVQLDMAVEVQALDAGSIDGMSVSEPFLTQLRSRGHHVLAAGPRLIPNAHMGNVLFGPSLLSRPELAQRFMNAYLRAARSYAEGSTPRNIEMIAKRTGFTPGMLREACLPRVDVNGTINLEALVAFQQWAVENGFLDRIVDPENAVDLSFARRAVEVLNAEQ